jgi:hypothetical protein
MEAEKEGLDLDSGLEKKKGFTKPGCLGAVLP